MSRLERYLMIATNLSVLMGLLFLGFQLRQERHAIEMQFQWSMAEVSSEIAMTLATDGELAALVSKAQRGEVAQFSEADHLRVRNWLSGFLEPRLSYYLLRESGFIPQSDWCNVMRSFVHYYENPYFRTVIDSYLSDGGDIASTVRSMCPRKGDV